LVVRPTDENIGSTKRQESRFGRAQRAPQGCRTGMCGINHGRGTKLKNRNRFGTRSERTVLERAANGLFWNAQRTDCFGTRSEGTVLERAANGPFWNAQRRDRSGTRRRFKRPT